VFAHVAQPNLVGGAVRGYTATVQTRRSMHAVTEVADRTA
jgi:hypothetical protein